MNKHCYRVIFSNKREQLVVVAEIVKSQSKSSSIELDGVKSNPGMRRDDYFFIKPIVLFGVLSFFFSQSTFSQVIADNNAPANQRPTILATPTGAPLVNIQTPSNSGISRNSYSQFDVDQRGVVLNNSHQSNPWLSKGEAKVILNEVNSSKPSMIGGQILIAGRQAELIVANPSGLNINGASIVNANRTLFTTGNSVFANNELQGFDITGGNIKIDGAGLNISGANYAALLSRVAYIQGAVTAGEINITTGLTTQNYKAGTAVYHDSISDKPAVAIDVSQLGGMYAEKITLLATEAGVGVRNAGNLQGNIASGQLIVTAAGHIENTGRMDAAISNVSTENHDIENHGVMAGREFFTLSSGRDVKLFGNGLSANKGSTLLQAKRDIVVASDAVVGNQLEGTQLLLSAGGSIILNKGSRLDSDGDIQLQGAGKIVSEAVEINSLSGGILALSGSDLLLQDSLLQAKKIHLETGLPFIETNSSINVVNTQLKAGESVDVISSGDLYIENKNHNVIDEKTNAYFFADNNIIIAAGTSFVTGGNFYLDAGKKLHLQGTCYEYWNCVNLPVVNIQAGGKIGLTGNDIEFGGSKISNAKGMSDIRISSNNTLLMKELGLDNGLGKYGLWNEVDHVKLSSGGDLIVSANGKIEIDGMDAAAKSILLVGGGVMVNGNGRVNSTMLAKDGINIANIAKNGGVILDNIFADAGGGDFALSSHGLVSVGGDLFNSKQSSELKGRSVYLQADGDLNTHGIHLNAVSGDVLLVSKSKIDINNIPIRQDKFDRGVYTYLGGTKIYASGNVGISATKDINVNLPMYSMHGRGIEELNKHFVNENKHHLESGVTSFSAGGLFSMNSHAGYVNMAYAKVRSIDVASFLSNYSQYYDKINVHGGGVVFNSDFGNIDLGDSYFRAAGNLAVRHDKYIDSIYIKSGKNAIFTNAAMESNRDLNIDVGNGDVFLNSYNSAYMSGHPSVKPKFFIQARNGNVYIAGGCLDGGINTAECRVNKLFMRRGPSVLNVSANSIFIDGIDVEVNGSFSAFARGYSIPLDWRGEVLPNSHRGGSISVINSNLQAWDSVGLYSGNDQNYKNTTIASEALDLHADAGDVSLLGSKFEISNVYNDKQKGMVSIFSGGFFSWDEKTEISAAGNLGVNVGRGDIALRLDDRLLAGKSLTLQSRAGSIKLNGVAANNGTAMRVMKLDVPEDINLIGRSVELEGVSVKAGNDINLIASDSAVSIGALKNRNAASYSNYRKDEIRDILNEINKEIALGSGGKNESANYLADLKEKKSDYEKIYAVISGKGQVSEHFLSSMGAKNINITAASGIDIYGVDINARDRVKMQAMGSMAATNTDTLPAAIRITGVLDSFVYGVVGSNNYSWLMLDWGSKINGKNGVSINAVGADVNSRIVINGAKVKSDGGKINIEAAGDVRLEAGQNEFYSYAQRRYKTGRWYNRKTVTETRMSHDVDIVPSILIGEDIQIKSGGSIDAYATAFDAPKGKISLVAANALGLWAVEEVHFNQVDIQKKSRFLGIAYNNSRSTSSQTVSSFLPARLVAERASTASGWDTRLQGTIFATSLAGADIRAGVGDNARKDAKIILEGIKSTIKDVQTSESNSVVWQAQKGQGSTVQIMELPRFIGPGAPTFSAPGGMTVQIAEGELRTQIQTLAKQPGLNHLQALVERNDVDWQPVKLAHEQWQYKQEGLTPAGAALVAIAVAIATGPGGAAATGSSTTTGAVAGTTAASSGIYAMMVDAAMTSLATQASIGLLNNKGDIGKTLKDLGSSDEVRRVVSAAVTAGVLDKLAVLDSMKELSNSSAYTDKLVFNMVNAGGQAISSVAMNGGDLSEALQGALVSALVSTAHGKAASLIKGLENQEILHKLAHAAAGCAAGAAGGGSCRDGAIGAAVGEIFAQMAFEKPALTASAAEWKAFDNKVLAYSKLVAGGIAAYAGGNASTAIATAETALLNNYLTNKELLALKVDLETCQAKKCSNDAVNAILDKYADISAYNDYELNGCMTADCLQEHRANILAALTSGNHGLVMRMVADSGGDHRRINELLDRQQTHSKMFQAEQNVYIVNQARKALDKYVVNNCKNLTVATCAAQLKESKATSDQITELLFGFSPLGIVVDVKYLVTAESSLDYATAVLGIVLPAIRIKAKGWGKGGHVAENITSACSASVSCFVAGTLVQTSSGLKPIETFVTGELVWSRSDRTGAQAYQPVLSTVATPDQPVWDVVVANADGQQETYSTTTEHPFWVEKLGWRKAAILQPGMVLRDRHGQPLQVVSVQLAQEKQTVFNIEVAEFNTYHIGTLGVWVHNAKCCDIVHVTPGSHSISGNISKGKMARAIELDVSHSQKNMIDDIMMHRDATGMKTEALVNAVLSSDPGIKILSGTKYAGNKGLDHVVQFTDKETGKVMTMIIDSKQMAKTGSARLNPNAAGGVMQLSTDSLNVIGRKIREAKRNTDAIDAIENARANGTLLKAVSYVNRNSGRLEIMPVIVQ